MISYIEYNHLKLSTQYQFMIVCTVMPFIIIFYAIDFKFIAIIEIPDIVNKFIYSGLIYVIYGTLYGIISKLIITDILHNKIKIQDEIILLCIYFLCIVFIPIFSRMGHLPYKESIQLIILNNSMTILGVIHYESEDEIYVLISDLSNTNDVKIKNIENLLVEKLCRVQKSEILFITEG